MVVRARIDELDKIDEYVNNDDMVAIDFETQVIKRHTVVRRAAITAMALRQPEE